MNLFLILAFLFFIGSVTGWVIELFFRKFFSTVSNPEHKWINPGFCIGPYLPLYGFGLCLMYLIASLEKYSVIENDAAEKIVLFLFMAVCMTVIEYIAGLFCLKVANVRLWDYSQLKGNIQGLICPQFSCAWALLGAVYYFLIHPRILTALDWLSRNLAFSFFIGLFYGVFIIDVVYSSQLIFKLRKFAEENDVIIRYENLKAQFRQTNDRMKERAEIRASFFFSLRSDKSVDEMLREMKESFEIKSKKLKSKIKNVNEPK